MTAALRLCLVIALAAAKPLSFCDRLGYLATNATHRRLGAGGRGQQHALPESRGRSKPERLPPTPGGLPRSSVPAHEARLAALEARRGGKTPREPKAGWWETTAESASANPAEHEQARDARSQPKVRAPKHAPLPKAKPATGKHRSGGARERWHGAKASAPRGWWETSRRYGAQRKESYELLRFLDPSMVDADAARYRDERGDDERRDEPRRRLAGPRGSSAADEKRSIPHQRQLAKQREVAAHCPSEKGPGVGRGCLAFFVHVAKCGGTSFSARRSSASMHF